MKRLKMLLILVFCLSILYLSWSCDNFIQKRYFLKIENKTDFDVCCYFYLVWGGGSEGVVYPDTALSFNKSELIFIKSSSEFRTSRAVSDINEWVASLPNDTISIFIFNNDTIENYSWETVQQNYKVLVRYDLSSEDVQNLYNKYGITEIPYPPDYRMKNMKMYPPYGTK
jgi:hypothetical protein